MTTHHHGACLCGAACYRVEGIVGRFYLCHCRHCRKDTGSAHAANLFLADARLDWLSGAGQVRHFALPGTRHARSFCATCGSALPYLLGSTAVVPAGSLDSALAAVPDGHLFMASRADWDGDRVDVPRFARLPE
ncbi:MAG: GFA family protein [Xanthomonadales bacterium]|nr:GFA family protein [Xanthomonadales bacterium]